MQKHIYISIYILLSSVALVAQTPIHLNAWTRISAAQPIAQKWRAEIELQHRRQNDFANASKNLLEYKLLNSVRTWVHYQHKNDLSFSVSPFAHYWHNSIIVNNSDKYKTPSQEIRFSIATDLKHQLSKGIWLVNRTCLEHRYFNNSNTNILRLRNRLGLQYVFNNQWNLTCFDEVFLNIKGVNTANIFDHNRLAFLLNYKPSNNVRLETGYIYISRLPKASTEFLNENNFLLHFYYILPHKVHYKHPNTQHHT